MSRAMVTNKGKKMKTAITNLYKSLLTAWNNGDQTEALANDIARCYWILKVRYGM